MRLQELAEDACIFWEIVYNIAEKINKNCSSYMMA
jgi:hypothetical protein